MRKTHNKLLNNGLHLLRTLCEWLSPFYRKSRSADGANWQGRYAFMIDLSKSCYLTGLANREAAAKPPLDALIARLGIQVVGDGYIDAITRLEHVTQFLTELDRLGIAVTDVTLWCDCTPENTQRLGCPHGGGGPGHANGYFSEMCEEDSFDVAGLGLIAPAAESECLRLHAQ